MMDSFKDAMGKLAIVGQSGAPLVDCSEVVPIPKAPLGKPATYVILYFQANTSDDILTVLLHF